MALIDLILNPLLWTTFLFFVALVVTLVLCLRSPHARTFIKMSIPFLARGQVLNAEFDPGKRNATFRLLQTDKTKLKRYFKKEDVWKNKTIEKGTYYIESSSGYPFYVTAIGDNKTIDPIKGVDPSRFDDMMAKTLIQTGEDLSEYDRSMAGEQEKIMGMTTGQLALVVVIMLAGVVAAMWMLATGMADISASVADLASKVGSAAA